MALIDRNIKSPEDAQRSVKEVRDWARSMEKFPPFGVVLKNKYITTSDTLLNHNLGYKYNGYLIIRSNAQVAFSEGECINKRKYLSLSASSAATVDIWVF